MIPTRETYIQELNNIPNDLKDELVNCDFCIY